MEWKPIETAPKDGTDILLHGNIAPGCPRGVADECWAGNTAVGAWWGGEGETGEWICYMSLVKENGPCFDPTHWMPLPDPPK